MARVLGFTSDAADDRKSTNPEMSMAKHMFTNACNTV